MADNLWGDFATFPKLRTPKSILREQADLLNRHTDGIVVAEITDDSDILYLKCSLELVAPTLNNYRYSVVSVRHKIGVFPCQLLPFGSLSGMVNCGTEAEFIETLGRHLGSDKVRGVVSALMAQSTS